MRVVSCEELQSLRAPNPADPDPRPEELAPASVPKDEAGMAAGPYGSRRAKTRSSPRGSNDAVGLSARHRPFDRRQRRIGLGAVGAAGLCQVGPAAAALAAEHNRGDARQIDRIVARDQIGRDADHDAGLAVAGDTDDGDDAGADLLL